MEIVFKETTSWRVSHGMLRFILFVSLAACALSCAPFSCTSGPCPCDEACKPPVAWAGGGVGCARRVLAYCAVSGEPACADWSDTWVVEDGHPAADGIDASLPPGAVAGLVREIEGVRLVAPAVRVHVNGSGAGSLSWEGVTGGWGLYSKEAAGPWMAQRFDDVLEVHEPGVYAVASELPEALAPEACTEVSAARAPKEVIKAVLDQGDWRARAKHDLALKCLDVNGDGELNVHDLAVIMGRSAPRLRGRRLGDAGRGFAMLGPPVDHAACLADGGVAVHNVCSYEGSARTVPMGARAIRTSAPPGATGIAAQLRFASGNITSFVPAQGVWGESRGNMLAFVHEQGFGSTRAGWVTLTGTHAPALGESTLVTDTGTCPLVLVNV